MGQKYEGTLIIQTNDNYSPTGDYVLTPLGNQADAAKASDIPTFELSGDTLIINF